MAAVIGLSAIFFLQDPFMDVRALTIQPQVPAGLLGVLTAPLVHGSLGHLAANCVAVLILGTLAGTVFPRATLRALPVIWLGSGLGTWLIATGGFHLGASGVLHGLAFLIATLALLRRDRASIAAALIALFFFGGMLVTILPHEMGVSWEYHLSGAVVGLLCAFVWRRADPLPPPRRYSWDEEAEAMERSDADLELPRPESVPVLWQREEADAVVLPFRPAPPPG